MLPGCIAYILLSNSIVALIKGEITPEFIAGTIIIIILLLIPIYFKKNNLQKMDSDNDSGTY